MSKTLGTGVHSGGRGGREGRFILEGEGRCKGLGFDLTAPPYIAAPPPHVESSPHFSLPLKLFFPANFQPKWAIPTTFLIHWRKNLDQRRTNERYAPVRGDHYGCREQPRYHQGELMGRRIYLSDKEVRVLNEALTKWDNWSWGTREEWEDRAYNNLVYKLLEDDE